MGTSLIKWLNKCKGSLQRGKEKIHTQLEEDIMQNLKEENK